MTSLLSKSRFNMCGNLSVVGMAANMGLFSSIWLRKLSLTDLSFDRLQVNNICDCLTLKRVHKYDQKLIFRQDWQTMLNKCCLNGPVPTGQYLQIATWDDWDLCSQGNHFLSALLLEIKKLLGLVPFQKYQFMFLIEVIFDGYQCNFRYSSSNKLQIKRFG